MSDKKRINQIAKETGLTNAELVSAAQTLGFEVKSHSSSVTAEQAEKIIQSAKTGTDQTAKVAEKPVKKSQPKAAESAKKNKEDHPRTFAGKAVVEDPAILSRIKAKEEAEKAAKVEVASTEHPVVTEKPKASEPVKKAEPKVEAKSEPKVEKVETKDNTATSKAEVKPENVADKKEPVVTEEKKKSLTQKPRIQIKVIKRAEDIKKEQAAARPEKKKFDKNRNDRNNRSDNRRPNQNGNGQGGNHYDKNRSSGQGQNQGQKRDKFASSGSAPATDSFTPATSGKTSRRDRDRKKSDNNRDNTKDGNRKGGPLRVNDNRNQVRNARNSNWNQKGGRGRYQNNQSSSVPATQRKFHELPESLEYEVGMNVQDIAKSIKREPAEIIKKLFMMGTMVNQNQSLDEDTIELILMDYGVTPVKKVEEDKSDIERLFVEDGYLKEENMVERPAVVTIMGHVDHGKTTLLDRFRESRVTEGEAGGITQHIGAYQIKANGKKITFLDTPGHEAFTSMRARGASVTDITILVVAADDGVMPQTIEAIDHAKSAGVPIIVAVNKIDKPGANPDHVMEQLMKYGLVPEDWGGDTIFVKISAKTGKNVEELLQMILLQADVMELKADPDQKAIGTVIEARLDKGRGSVADIFVQQGTLKVGDPIVVGDTFGRVRVMTNDKGRRVKKATPSTPVEITGLNDVPEAADKLVVFDDEKTARSVGEQRAKNALEKQRENVQHVTLDNLFDTMKKENMKEVDIVLKADVQGSAEALQQSLEKIEVEGVRVNIIHSGVGAINESDVTLAGASNAFIVGFNVRPTNTAKSQADSEGVDIRLYNIIYKVMDDVEAAMKGMLEPTYEEKVTGNLTVRETWKVSKIGTIAGAFVDNGYVTRDSGIRVIRDGIVKYDGKVASLKRFKDDVKEVKQGFDCGITIENFNDIKVDDQLEAYEMQEVPVK